MWNPLTALIKAPEPIILPHPASFDHYHHLEARVEAALYDAQGALDADPDNEHLEMARNALSDAYRHLMEANAYYSRVHRLTAQQEADNGYPWPASENL